MLVAGDTGGIYASSAELTAFRASCLDSVLRKHRESLSGASAGGGEGERGRGNSPPGHQVWNSSSRSVDMVFFTSVLLMHDALASLFNRRLDPYEPPLEWFGMARGVFFVSHTAMSVAAEDPDSHTMALVRAADDMRDVYNPNPEEEQHSLRAFPELIYAKAADGETWLETEMERTDEDATDAYHHTVSQVGAMRRALDRGADWKDLGRRLTMFAVILRPRFIELLQDRRPKAFVILAHYFAVATYATRFWWVGDVPFREFDALDKVLPAEWQHLLRWPREIVEQHRHASIAS